ncbi:hypothetical protein C5F49_04380 [Nitrosopumilus oxyclinae]|uniref:Uncharacterized protein n=1 Tax=Nitrosopumilus oxyclinae TaxID=1959104 RepID=A0A7D5M2T9_9ARCH|nr:hypothetical protein [Nitrosopumilus oxyclinae]QLH04631.1 hypothetical protein C5F49_04380 [Nitrosopumilus oxyclinae]
MLSIFVIPVQAQTTSEFGYQLHPGKLLENTEATLQIFITSNDIMVPKQIDGLKVVSSDNEIIQIIRIEEGNDKFTKNVIIKAKESGIASIALAATGFSSKEISLEVFTNNNNPTKMLMKVTPSEFPVDGPRFGFIVVELATTGGLPAITSEEVMINLDTPNKDVINIKESELVISGGEYYAITEFEILDYGDAIIFAETGNMKKISSIVKVLEPITPLQLQLYVHPENYISFSGSEGYAIVQLLDGDGLPVFAEEDIHLEIGVENPDVSINTSNKFEEVMIEEKNLVIKKGSYSTFTKFSPRPNLGEFTSSFEETYKMFISAENILTNGATFTVIHDEIGSLEGKGPSVTETLPFLTTGKQEIIAVTYYETEIEVSRQTGGSTQGTTNRELVSVTVPVKAQEDHKIIFSSSELDSVNPIDPLMKKGESAIIVFGDTGTVVPEDPVSFYITDNEGVKTATGDPIGPLEEDLELIIESLVPVVLAEKEFPVLGYLNEGAGEEETSTSTSDEEGEVDPRLGVSYFIEDGVLSFSANELINADSITIKRNQPFAEFNLVSKVGTTDLSYQMGGFEGISSITSHTTDPTTIYLSFQKNILANSKTLATVQALDSVGNPVYAKKDIKINLVSNNETILKVPEKLLIKEGDYFSTFEIDTVNEGTIELALLSEDFTLSKYDINVIDISPVVTLEFLGGLNWNERIESKISITIPEVTTALGGFNVEWDIVGGEILTTEQVTSSEGIAKANILANDKDKVSVSVTVSGNGLSSTTISKTANILNMPVMEEISEEEPDWSGLPIDNTLLVMIIIPVAILTGLFFLKRMDKLDIITEKIPIGDKIEEVKERISDIRNR